MISTFLNYQQIISFLQNESKIPIVAAAAAANAIVVVAVAAVAVVVKEVIGFGFVPIVSPFECLLALEL